MQAPPFTAAPKTEGKRIRKLAPDGASTLMGREDFADAYHWEELASGYKVRMPINGWDRIPQPLYMKRLLRKLDISLTAYFEWSGTKALKDFHDMNPAWPLSAWLGLLLERKERGTL